MLCYAVLCFVALCYVLWGFDWWLLHEDRISKTKKSVAAIGHASVSKSYVPNTSKSEIMTI